MQTRLGDILRYWANTDSSPVELLKEMKQVASEAEKLLEEEPLFDFTIKNLGNRLEIEAPIPLEEPVDQLRAAVIMGIVAGVLEASGVHTYIVTDPVKARKTIRSSKAEASMRKAMLYLEQASETARIVAEYV